MALFDISNIAKKLQEAGEGIAKTVSDAAEKLPEIKPDEVIDAVKTAAQKGADTLGTMISDVTGKDNECSDNDGNEEKDNVVQKKDLSTKDADPTPSVVIPAEDLSVTIECALKIIYCLMSVDGNISPEEEEKFKLIGQELDPAFSDHMESVIQDCNNRTQGAEDSEEYYEMIHDLVSDSIREPVKKGEASIRGKLLVWDLYCIMYSDNSYSQEEKKLFRYICRALHIDKTMCSEMEQTLKTLIVIEEEINWLKTTNRQFKMIEDRLNELAERKQTIMQSINTLIAD